MTDVETETPLRLAGRVHLVLGYRLASARGDRDRVRPLRLSADEHRALREDLGRRVGGARWQPGPGRVHGEILLPHLSWLLGDGNRAEEGPGCVEVHELQVENIAWKESGPSRAMVLGGWPLRLCEPPVLFVFGTGIAYLVLSTEPFAASAPPQEEADGFAWMDAAKLADALYELARTHWTKKERKPLVPTEGPGFRPWQSLIDRCVPEQLREEVRTSTQVWDLAAACFLRPFLGDGWLLGVTWSLDADRRSSDRRLIAPAVVACLAADREPTPGERERLRNLVRWDQRVDLPPGELRGEYRPSAEERCLFGPKSVFWLDRRTQRLKNHAGEFARRQLFLWLLVAHQRDYLLLVNTQVASVGLEGDEPGSKLSWALSASLRESLVLYGARYHFVVTSIEDRLERFYQEALAQHHVSALFAETEREVQQVHELVAAQAEEAKKQAAAETSARTADADSRRNVALGFLAFVISPLGFFLSLWQFSPLNALPFETCFTPAFLAVLVAVVFLGYRFVPEDFDKVLYLLRRRGGSHRAPGDSDA